MLENSMLWIPIDLVPSLICVSLSSICVIKRNFPTSGGNSWTIDLKEQTSGIVQVQLGGS